MARLSYFPTLPCCVRMPTEPVRASAAPVPTWHLALVRAFGFTCRRQYVGERRGQKQKQKQKPYTVFGPSRSNVRLRLVWTLKKCSTPSQSPVQGRMSDSPHCTPTYRNTPRSDGSQSCCWLLWPAHLGPPTTAHHRVRSIGTKQKQRKKRLEGSD
jgi:hypothetical protein